jgi:hypothetical protein
MAMSFNNRINITPKGFIHCAVKLESPAEAEITLQITPSNKPIMIFQCNANFFPLAMTRSKVYT